MMQEIEKRNSSLTLRERLAVRRIDSKVCLLLDVSASMASDIEPKVPKINALRDIVSGIAGNPITIEFSTDARVGSKNCISDPRGNTNMARAFNLAKDQGFSDCLMLTDGEATDKIDALEAINGLKVQIMYIGAGPRPEFLDKLAAKSGSFVSSEDLRKPKELTTKIQLLLGAGPGESKGSICL